MPCNRRTLLCAHVAFARTWPDAALSTPLAAMSAKAVVKICDMPPDMLDSASLPAVSNAVERQRKRTDGRQRYVQNVGPDH